MATLTKLDSRQGFATGDLDTSGYVAVIPAFQKVYVADGRNYDDKGYHKVDFINTKIMGTANAALTHGEPVSQTTSGATGFYDECTDIKITGALSDADVPFQLGEKVTQDLNPDAIGYVTYVGSGFINVCPISRDPETGELVDFTAGTTDVVGATSGAIISNPTDCTNVTVDCNHFIYRTSTTEFDSSNVITGAISTKTITPLAAAGAVQHIYTDGTASAGTFTVTYDGETTAAIAYNANAATIKAALELLDTVDTDDITVSFESGTDFTDVSATDAMVFTFATDLGSVPSVSVTESLTGVTAVTVKPMVSGHTTVTAPPHWLTWRPVASYSGTTNPGIMPDGGSNIGCACFGRIFLNSINNPHQWFCSRVFDPLDWDSSQTDVAAATYSQSAKAHEVGNPLVAMVSYKDHYLVWGCANETWLLQSDPLMGGVNRCLSKATGFFSPTSYCWDDKNNLYFLGTDGVYRLSAEAIINAMPPENMTKQRNPKLVSSLALNRRTDRVAMGYDKQRYGIKISVTQQDGQWSVHWWLDLRTGGIFPEKYSGDQNPASLFYFDSYKASERGLLLGGYDGYIRKEDEDEKSDDGSNAIAAHFTIGPFVANGEPRNQIEINETSLVLGEDTDGVTVDFYSGTSADEVISNVLDEATPDLTKTLTGDSIQSSITERVSGRAVAVQIKNETADETFSIEEINLSMYPEGRKK